MIFYASLPMLAQCGDKGWFYQDHAIPRNAKLQNCFNHFWDMDGNGKEK